MRGVKQRRGLCAAWWLWSGKHFWTSWSLSGMLLVGLLVRVAVGIRGLDGLESTFGAMFGAL
jgi:hypothetical protein